MPTDVKILGRENSVVTFDAPGTGNNNYAFIVSNGSNVEISGFSFQLSGRSGAVKFENSTNISANNLVVTSDLVVGNPGPLGPLATILAENSSNVILSDNIITNARSGIYALDSNSVEIKNNILDNVNFGQFVISGSDFDVSGNFTHEAGQAGQGSITVQGDGLTLLGATNVIISNNFFENGNCYGISFSAGINSNVSIFGNVIKTGITNAIYSYVDVANVDIYENIFKDNNGNALAFAQSAQQIQFRNNNTVDDGLLFLGSATDIMLSENLGLNSQIVNFATFNQTLYSNLINFQISPTNLTGNILGAGSSTIENSVSINASLQAQSFLAASAVQASVGDAISISDLLVANPAITEVQIIDADLRNDTAKITGTGTGTLPFIAAADFATTFITAADHYVLARR